MKLPQPWFVYIANGLGLGELPKSPGTFGSLWGILLAYLIHPFGVFVGVAVGVALTALAYFTIEKTEEHWQLHDSPRIVIDEVVGQYLALVFVPISLWIYVAGFVGFRFLDIYKPLAIGWLDRNLPGGWGTLLDDVLAGLVTALLLFLIPV